MNRQVRLGSNSVQIALDRNDPAVDNDWVSFGPVTIKQAAETYAARLESQVLFVDDSLELEVRAESCPAEPTRLITVERETHFNAVNLRGSESVQEVEHV